MITVYGNPTSRAFRTYWMLEELGIPYEGIPKDTRGGETRTRDFLAINPNGHVPTLVDGELVIWESMAINLYLARKHGGPLAPRTLEEEAAALQWSFWVMTEVEGNLLTHGMHSSFLPPEERSPQLAAEAGERARTALRVLDAPLARRPHLAGERFTVADLNVAAVLSWTRLMGIDLAGHPHVARWLDACLARPAARKLLGS
jgi:glutathione S-transferase